MKTYNDCATCEAVVCADCGAVYSKSIEKGGAENMAQYKECPLCHAALDPGEKCDCEEESAKKFIEEIGEAQKVRYVGPCPRCGSPGVFGKYPTLKALSRQATVSICDCCGTDEAMLAYYGKPPLAFSEWAAVRKGWCIHGSAM